MPLYASPTKNAIQKELAANLSSGVTASMTLNNIDGIPNLPGVCVVDRINSTGTLTTTKREYIAYTGTSGVTLTGLTRNVDSSGTDQDHSVGAIVEFIPDVTWATAIRDALSNLVNTTTLAIDTTKVVTPTGTQTLTNKTLTSPVLNTGVSGTAVLDEDDMSSNSATALATQQSIKAYVDTEIGNLSLPAADGWTSLSETFTYASATTITVATGAATRFKKGDKIKLTQTTVKYFYVIDVADTLLTVTGGSDYTVANAAITDPHLSRLSSPIGFPDYFNITVASWATSGSAFTNAPTTPTFRMAITENRAWLWGIFLTNATSGGTGIFRATITSNQIPNRVDSSLGNAMNISQTSNTGVCYISNTNEISIQKYDATAIASNNAYFDISLWYMF